MLESFLRAGRQEPRDLARLVYGQSITDACMDVDTTADVLGELATAARHRRALVGSHRTADRPGAAGRA
jgi:3-deoxy-7-phosphoheptulonate synthase